MKFHINEYKGKFAMHCKTEEEAEDFCNYLSAHGRKWRGGNSYKDTKVWHIYRQNTTYYFNEGCYADVDYSKCNNYTILEWEDFMEKTFTKADLKTGDVILRRDGEVEIVMKDFKSFLRNDGEYNAFYGIKDDLTSTHATSRDIVAVRRPTRDMDCVFSAFENKRGTLVYDRKCDEVEEMTLEQVCKLLGKNIKIIK